MYFTSDNFESLLAVGFWLLQQVPVGDAMQTRRMFGVGVLATSGLISLPTILKSQALRPIRLLVVRKPGFSLTNSCVAPCIRGKLYDVSDTPDFRVDNVVLSLLKAPICDLIERPWRNNSPSKSSIPVGLYAARVRDDATKGWMTNIDRRWRMELSGVPHRSHIQFHYGRDVDWSEGCFIVGDLLQPDGSTGMEAAYCGLEGGEAAVARLRAVVEGPGTNPADIMIGVTDDYGLFPDFGSNPDC